MSSFRPLRRSALFAALFATSTLVSAQQLKSTVWWDESESGWGLYIADQGNVLAPFWFTNDTNGKPVWFLTAALRQADGSYAGEVQRVTGVPLAQIAGQASDPGVVIGNATLRFTGDNALRFDYTVNGQAQTKQLTRFPFGDKDVVCRAAPANRAAAGNFSDIWVDPASLGWGIHLSHVDNDLYATWYTYDTDRQPIYYQGVTRRQADGGFTGQLFRSNDGTPFNQINGAPANSGASVVGSLSFRFTDGQNGRFDYSVGGVTQNKSIQRFQFGDTASVCSVEAYSTGDPGGGGQGDDCLPPYSVGDVREVRVTDESSTFSRTERIVGNASFQGQDALVEEYSGQTSAGNGVYARNYVQNGQGTRISFGAEAVDPSSGALISRSVNQPISIELPRAFAIGESRQLVWKVNSTAQGVSTSEDLRNKYTLQARESVTVPAGTFTACRFAYEVDLDSSINVQGISTTIRVRRTGTTWTSPQFGMVKFEDSGTADVSTPFSNTSTAVSTRIELLSATVGGNSTR